MRCCMQIVEVRLCSAYSVQCLPQGLEEERQQDSLDSRYNHIALQSVAEKNTLLPKTTVNRVVRNHYLFMCSAFKEGIFLSPRTRPYARHNIHKYKFNPFLGGYLQSTQNHCAGFYLC